MTDECWGRQLSNDRLEALESETNQLRRELSKARVTCGKIGDPRLEIPSTHLSTDSELK